MRVPTIKELDGELCRLCNRAALTLQGADFAKPAGLGCLDLQSSPILRAQRRRGAGWTNRRPGFASLCRPGSRFALSQKFRFFGVTAVNHQLFGRHRTQTLTFKAASATSTFKLSTAAAGLRACLTREEVTGLLPGREAEVELSSSGSSPTCPHRLGSMPWLWAASPGAPGLRACGRIGAPRAP